MATSSRPRRQAPAAIAPEMQPPATPAADRPAVASGKTPARKPARPAAPAAAKQPAGGAAKPAAQAPAKATAKPAAQATAKQPAKPAVALAAKPAVAAEAATTAAVAAPQVEAPAAAAAPPSPAQPARGARPRRAARPAQVAQPAQPAQPAQAEQPKKAKPAQPAKPTAPARSARPRPAPVAETAPAAPVAPALAAKPAAPAMPPADKAAGDTVQAVLDVLTTARPAPPTRPVAPPARPVVPPAAPTGPADSAIVLLDGDQRRVFWQPGHACPEALRAAAMHHVDAEGCLSPEDDQALPLLQRLAHEARHTLRVDEAVWGHLAARRDARHRLTALEAAYPQGPSSPPLQALLRAPLPLFQAEGALFAVVAGRALIADERGLGKSVQAIAAARLWQQHFGVQRVLVLCAARQRLSWQRAWRRFAGVDEAQLVDGGQHQRQALWSADAGVRILSPETLARDAAQLAFWAPDLIIVDEPQQLALQAQDWQQLAAPHALVLCGAALAEQAPLMAAIVDWLDAQRLGPLAALRELHAASEGGRMLDEADVERLTGQLSRLMLQRLRADLADQLPPLVHSERLVDMAHGQQEQHDRHAVEARRLLAGWQRSGYCSDSDQWRLALALREMQRACHRADPADPHSALAEATLQALAAQLEDWTHTGPLQAAVLCASAADREQLAERLADWLSGGTQAGGELHVSLLGPDEPLPGGLDAVLQIGVPWRPRRQPAGARGSAAAGQQCVYLVARDGIDSGLFDTLAQRLDVPRGLTDGGSRSYLQGETLSAWLQALLGALTAMATTTA